MARRIACVKDVIDFWLRDCGREQIGQNNLYLINQNNQRACLLKLLTGFEGGIGANSVVVELCG